MSSVNFTLQSRCQAGPDAIARLLVNQEALKSLRGINVRLVDHSYAQVRVFLRVLGGVTITSTKEWNGVHMTQGVITDQTRNRHLLEVAATTLAHDVSNKEISFRQA